MIGASGPRTRRVFLLTPQLHATWHRTSLKLQFPDLAFRMRVRRGWRWRCGELVRGVSVVTCCEVLSSSRIKLMASADAERSTHGLFTEFLFTLEEVFTRGQRIHDTPISQQPVAHTGLESTSRKTMKIVVTGFIKRL